MSAKPTHRQASSHHPIRAAPHSKQAIPQYDLSDGATKYHYSRTGFLSIYDRIVSTPIDKLTDAHTSFHISYTQTVSPWYAISRVSLGGRSSQRCGRRSNTGGLWVLGGPRSWGHSWIWALPEGQAWPAGGRWVSEGGWIRHCAEDERDQESCHGGCWLKVKGGRGLGMGDGGLWGEKGLEEESGHREEYILRGRFWRKA